MNKLKYLLIFLLFSAYQSLFAEPRGRFIFDDPDIGLPSGEEVGIGILIALIAFPLGQFILHSNNDSKDENVGCGCLGVFFCGLSIVCLLPLLAWICSILFAIIGIGFVLVIIIIILALIYSFFSKK